jgi:Uma2 family endonuclease
MSSAFTPTPTRFNVDQFLRMDQAGVFQDSSRVELVEGELLNMAPIGAPHVFAVGMLNQLIVDWSGALLASEQRPMVLGQSPVVLSDITALQPDLVILRSRPDGYRTKLPTADDVGLLIEVGDTSAHHDRTRKAAVYALHGIDEYWLLDLEGQQLEVHREPRRAGGYASIESFRPGQLAPAPAAFPSLLIPWWKAIP